MSLISRIAERTPEIINEASEGAKDMVIAPNPNLISPASNAASGIGLQAIAVFAIVALLAGIMVWQTVKIYRPSLFARF
jgi:hypothetical protein